MWIELPDGGGMRGGLFRLEDIRCVRIRGQYLDVGDFHYDYGTESAAQTVYDHLLNHLVGRNRLNLYRLHNPPETP